MQQENAPSLNNFPERLAYALKIKRMSQSDLAREAQVAVSTVSRWNQTTSPRRITVNAIAKAIGVREEWLLNGEGEMFTGPPIFPEHSINVHELPVNMAASAAASMSDEELAHAIDQYNAMLRDPGFASMRQLHAQLMSALSEELSKRPAKNHAPRKTKY